MVSIPEIKLINNWMGTAKNSTVEAGLEKVKPQFTLNPTGYWPKKGIFLEWLESSEVQGS
jgi:hypothetical protein